MPVHVIDAEAALELARRDFVPRDGHEFFAPTLLRSQALARCRTLVRQGRVEEGAALDLAERACRLPRRLLGDAVLRRTAWKLATEHGWPDTFHAEYIALTRLHGDALVAGDAVLRELAEPLVAVLDVDTCVATM